MIPCTHADLKRGFPPMVEILGLKTQPITLCSTFIHSGTKNYNMSNVKQAFTTTYKQTLFLYSRGYIFYQPTNLTMTRDIV